MVVVADLHVHTTNSDGALRLRDLPAAASRAGLEAVAVTDHDRVHPDLAAPVSTMDGATVVHGIELRVESDAGRVDLLGYAVDPTPALRDEVERLQRDRVRRGAAIVKRVEEALGIDLGLEPREGIGRPHIARAVADHPDTDYDVQRTFDELIGDGRPCFVSRDVPDFDRGRRLLEGACALVGLAHPLRYDDPEATLALASDLDAVERWYPYDRPVDPEDVERRAADVSAVERAIDEWGLLATGGSDAHGDRLGRAGLDQAAYALVLDRLPAPA